MGSQSLSELSLFKEVKENKRLQWLLLVILLILCISGLKLLIDINHEKYVELEVQQRLNARLQLALEKPFDEENLRKLESATDQLVSEIPVAPAQSIAEAQALSKADKIRETILKSGRARLIGTEQIMFAGNAYFQTRIELVGTHDLLKFIELLKEYDGSNSSQRIVTLQLIKNRRDGTLTVVADFLHRQSNS